jgi:hypothetical protein
MTTRRPTSSKVPIFEEVQALWSNALARVVIIVSSLMSILIMGAIAIAGPTAQAPQLVLVMLLIIFVDVLFLKVFRLITRVSADRLSVTFRPFITRRIELKNIVNAKVVKYNPIRDCGGWGIKRSRTYGLVFNMAGEHGVAVEMTDRKMLIGSLRSDELLAALRSGGVGESKSARKK